MTDPGKYMDSLNAEAARQDFDKAREEAAELAEINRQNQPETRVKELLELAREQGVLAEDDRVSVAFFESSDPDKRLRLTVMKYAHEPAAGVRVYEKQGEISRDSSYQLDQITPEQSAELGRILFRQDLQAVREPSSDIGDFNIPDSPKGL